MAVLKIGTNTIDYKVRVTKLARRISVKVDEEGEVTLVVPSKRSLARGESFIQSHANWIAEKLKTSKPAIPAIVNIKEIEILNEQFTLNWQKDHTGRVSERAGVIKFGGYDVKVARKQLSDYLQKKYGQLLVTRTEELCKEGNKHLKKPIKYKRVSVRDQSSRWGSYSTTGTLSLNWRLILAPVDVMDYVIWHELSHSVHHNHSTAFWNLVKKLDPTYEAKEEWLKKNRAYLFSF